MKRVFYKVMVFICLQSFNGVLSKLIGIIFTIRMISHIIIKIKDEIKVRKSSKSPPFIILVDIFTLEFSNCNKLHLLCLERRGLK